MFYWDWALLFGLGIVTFFDLSFRWLAFGRVESAAIDIVLFTSVYAAVESAHVRPDEVWLQRLIVNAVILIALLITHRFNTDQLKRMVSTRLEEIQEDLCSRGDVGEAMGAQVARLNAAKRLAERNVVLALEVPVFRDRYVREGKATWRSELCELLNAVSPIEPSTKTGIRRPWKVTDFLLSATRRWIILVGFSLGALIAIVVLVTPVLSQIVSNI
jgi:hypothetical protein